MFQDSFYIISYSVLLLVYTLIFFLKYDLVLSKTCLTMRSTYSSVENSKNAASQAPLKIQIQKIWVWELAFSQEVQVTLMVSLGKCLIYHTLKQYLVWPHEPYHCSQLSSRPTGLRKDLGTSLFKTVGYIPFEHWWRPRCLFLAFQISSP